MCAGNDDLRSLRPDPRNHRALGVRHLRQPGGQPPHQFHRSLILACSIFAAALPAHRPRGIRQGRRCSGGPHDKAHAAGIDAAAGPTQLAVDKLPQPADFLLLRHLAAQEFLGQPHRAERQADRLPNALVLGKCDFAAAAAYVDQQAPPAGTRLVLDHAAMDEPSFLEARNDLDLPARSHPAPRPERPANSARRAWPRSPPHARGRLRAAAPPCRTASASAGSRPSTPERRCLPRKRWPPAASPRDPRGGCAARASPPGRFSAGTSSIRYR